MKRMKVKGVPVVVNEPTLDAPEFFGCEVMHDPEVFKTGFDIIVAKRWSDELADVLDKVYTRVCLSGILGERRLRDSSLMLKPIYPKEGVSACADTPSFG